MTMFNSIQDLETYLNKLAAEDRLYHLEDRADEIFEGSLGQTMEAERQELWAFCEANEIDPFECKAFG